MGKTITFITRDQRFDPGKGMGTRNNTSEQARNIKLDREFATKTS